MAKSFDRLCLPSPGRPYYLKKNEYLSLRGGTVSLTQFIYKIKGHVTTANESEVLDYISYIMKKYI